MMPTKLYANLLSYTFIFIGLGIILEALLVYRPELSYIKIPLRYFYWTFNAINLFHLLLLIIYKSDKNEKRRSQLFFFCVVNHFLVSLIAVGVYAMVWLKGGKVEALIAISLYLATFIFFMKVMLSEGKR